MQQADDQAVASAVATVVASAGTAEVETWGEVTAEEAVSRAWKLIKVRLLYVSFLYLWYSRFSHVIIVDTTAYACVPVYDAGKRACMQCIPISYRLALHLESPLKITYVNAPKRDEHGPTDRSLPEPRVSK